MVLTKWDVTCGVVLAPGVCFAVMFHQMTRGFCRVRDEKLYSIKVLTVSNLKSDVVTP